MVCLYCHGETKVTNSRSQKRQNQVWRRRQCLSCKANFTTHEKLALEGALALKASNGQLTSFQSEKLLISLYESCRHRPNAASDASALLGTCLAKISLLASSGIIDRKQIIENVGEVLAHFDQAASIHYRAFHQVS